MNSCVCGVTLCPKPQNENSEHEKFAKTCQIQKNRKTLREKQLADLKATTVEERKSGEAKSQEMTKVLIVPSSI